MKKLIYSIIIMIAGFSQAQVIISNQANPTPTNSSVLLEFGNNENKGIILPSVSEVTNPVAGTFAVNTTAKAVQYYNGTAWINLTYPNMLVENSFINDGTADVGEGVVIGAASSTKPGVLVLESTTQAMVLPHVADPHLNVLSPVAGTMVYDTTSDALAVYDGIEWSYWAAQATTPPTNPTGTGSLSGRMCFDVVEINDGGDCGTLTSRLPQKADFLQTATNTQTYTFKPSGTVSNVRFMYFNTNGQVIQSITPDADYSGTLTSAQTATATVVFYNNLNTTAAGLSRDAAYLGDIYVVYNDGTGDKQLKLTTRVQDCNCCGAMTFANPDGTGGVVWTEFMCHNLGADTALDPFTPAKGIHGGKYRWGNITSPMGAAPSISQATDQFYGDTIPGFNTNTGDMSAPDGTWSDTNKTASDPCPVGYRVPTKIEWDGVVANNTITRSTPLTNWYEGTVSNQNYSTGLMFGTSLFLPSEGSRASQARIRNRGAQGVYLSTTTQGTSGTQNVFALQFFYDQFPNTPDGTSVINYASRWNLNSVRCIAE